MKNEDLTPMFFDPYVFWSPECTFCVVPGQDKKSRPMLERIAAELIEATESLAYEDLHLFNNKNDFVRTRRIYSHLAMRNIFLNMIFSNQFNKYILK